MPILKMVTGMGLFLLLFHVFVICGLIEDRVFINRSGVVSNYKKSCLKYPRDGAKASNVLRGRGGLVIVYEIGGVCSPHDPSAPTDTSVPHVALRYGLG